MKKCGKSHSWCKDKLFCNRKCLFFLHQSNSDKIREKEEEENSVNVEVDENQIKLAKEEKAKEDKKKKERKRAEKNEKAARPPASAAYQQKSRHWSSS